MYLLHWYFLRLYHQFITIRKSLTFCSKRNNSLGLGLLNVVRMQQMT